jgi:hypothetical protein
MDLNGPYGINPGDGSEGPLCGGVNHKSLLIYTLL